LEYPCDWTKGYFHSSSSFAVEISDRKWWSKNQRSLEELYPRALLCFTDGSKTNGYAGCAYVIPSLGEEGTFALGEHATVFQCELYAILMLAYRLTELDLGDISEIRIYTDSLSSLQSLQALCIESAIAEECWRALEKLARQLQLFVSWIPAHAGYEGNETADRLAKCASELRIPCVEPVIPISVKLVTSSVKAWARSRHARKWETISNCRQAKQFFPTLEDSLWESCANLSRPDMAIYTQIATGHNRLNRHLTLMGVGSNPSCPLCGEEEDTSAHVLCNCQHLIVNRLHVFHRPEILLDELCELTPGDIVQFIRKSGRLGS